MKLQLTVLSSVLQLMLLATIFNVNGGVALFPMQLLFCKFFVVVAVVVGFIADVPDPERHAPAAPPTGNKDRHPPQIVRWLVSGFIVAGPRSRVLQWGPDKPSTRTRRLDDDGVAIVGAQRREPRRGYAARAESPGRRRSSPTSGGSSLGWVLTWAAVELHMLQRLLDTGADRRRSGSVVASLLPRAPRRSSGSTSARHLANRQQKRRPARAP